MQSTVLETFTFNRLLKIYPKLQKYTKKVHSWDPSIICVVNCKNYS